METKVLVVKESEVALITLNRPQSYNSLDRELLEALRTHLQDVSTDKGVRAVVLTGAGKAFCAGGDLKAMMSALRGPSVGVYDMATLFHHAAQEVRRMRKPVVAAVNGVAAGGGLSLALACDFRVMARSAVMKHAYTSGGLSPDGGGSYTLPRLVGLARAMEIMAFDRPISSEQALQWGLVTEVADDGQVLEAAMGMARTLAQGSTHAFGVFKRLLTDSFETGFEGQLEKERSGISSCAGHRDGEEGMRAFIEKRKPSFRDQ